MRKGLQGSVGFNLQPHRLDMPNAIDQTLKTEGHQHMSSVQKDHGKTETIAGPLYLTRPVSVLQLQIKVLIVVY